MIPIKITDNTRHSAENLYNAINDRLLSGSWKCFDSVDVFEWIKIQTDGQYSLKDIVTAEPALLHAIQKVIKKDKVSDIPKCCGKKRTKENKKYKWVNSSKIVYPTLELYERFLSQSCTNIGTKSHPYSSLNLVQDTGLTVCPYCNRQYINNASEKRSSQLDHFYPKNEFPLLAVSFYNLIPSCASCNHTKGTNEFYQSPYGIDDVDSFFKFIFNLGTEHLNDLSHIEIDIYEPAQTDSKKHSDILDLKSHYQIHKDYLQEILRKNQTYDNSYLEKLRNDFPFPMEECLRTIWGNYFRKDLLGKRPLSKLIRDVLLEIRPEVVDEIDKMFSE